MYWWQNEITDEIANEFLNECRQYTVELIKRQAKEKFLQNRTTPLYSPFTPTGAVISITETTEIWSFIRAAFLGNFGCHFLITSRRNEYGKYMKYFPGTILLLGDPTKAVAHAGYLSNITWGISIRNAGQLRPYRQVFDEDKPPPIFYGEETKKLFNTKPYGDVLKYYAWENLWREEVYPSTRVIQHPNGNFYEQPSKNAIQSLIILLQILNKITPMLKEFIVPSHCVQKDTTLALPTINWDTIRELGISNENILGEGSFDYLTSSNTTITDEWIDKTPGNEAVVHDVAKRHKWRSNADDGNINYLLSGAELTEAKPNVNHRGAAMLLKYMGYDTTMRNTSFAHRMFFLREQKEKLFRKTITDDCITLATKVAKKDFGIEVDLPKTP